MGSLKKSLQEIKIINSEHIIEYLGLNDGWVKRRASGILVLDIEMNGRKSRYVAVPVADDYLLSDEKE